MDITEVTNKIKQRGYWEVNFRPSRFSPQLIPDRGVCKEILIKSAVSLRGWDYPHIPSREDETQALYLGNDYCEAYIDWEKHKEALRFYQSGQFIHYLALWEDWLEEDTWMEPQWKQITPRSVLNVTVAIYTVTEIFEFLKRMSTRSNIYDEGVKVEIKLVGIKGRKLVLMEPMRVPLVGNYVAHVPESKPPLIEMTRKDVADRSAEIALETIKHIFDTFNWETQPTGVFKKDQQKLLERRL